MSDTPIPAPRDFDSVDLNAFPPPYSYPRKYWNLRPPFQQVQWLLDQDRFDDALVYFLFGWGTSFVGEIWFLHSRPDHQEIVARLRSEGRIKLYGDGLPRRFRTNELVLGPNSRIEKIIEDVAFLLEPQHPWYTSNDPV